jgi:hypothetical protein
MFISRRQLSENILSFHTIFHELTLSFLSVYLNVLETNVEVKLYKLRMLFCCCLLEQTEVMGNYDFDLKILNVSKIHCIMKICAL